MKLTDYKKNVLIKKVNAYFSSKERNRSVYAEEAAKPEKSTHVVTDRNFRFPVTISGLAAAIHVDKCELIDIMPEMECYEVIKDAKRIIEAYAEDKLLSSAGGIILSLRVNHGWAEAADKSELDLSSEQKLEEIFKRLNFYDYNAAELLELAAEDEG